MIRFPQIQPGPLPHEAAGAKPHGQRDLQVNLLLFLWELLRSHFLKIQDHVGRRRWEDHNHLRAHRHRGRRN